MDQVLWVLSRVRFPNSTVHILDLECGEGDYLDKFATAARAHGADIKTYGLEPNIARSHRARQKLDIVRPGGIGRTEISHGAFSMVYTRPRPTRREKQEHDDAGQYLLRSLLPSKERDIFQRATSYLAVGGVLVMQVIQERLAELANLIAHRLEDVELAFVERPFYDDVWGPPGKDVIIFGRKAPVRAMTQEARAKAAEMRKWIEEVAEKGDLPLLEPSHEPYMLPLTKGPSIFRTDVLDPELLEEELMSSPAWREMEEWMKPEDHGGHRPPLPLHLGHIGLLLSTGLLDGRVANHLMKGRIVKERRSSTDIDENGFEINSEHDRYKIEVRVLEANGNYFDL